MATPAEEPEGEAKLIEAGSKEWAGRTGAQRRAADLVHSSTNYLARAVCLPIA